MKRLFCVFAVAAFFMLSVVCTTAQTINGTITGSVVDQQKAAIPGATVTAKNVETGLERSVTTDENGLFRISALPGGIYSVRVTGSGFAPRVRENVQVSVAQDTSLDFDMAPGSVEATVEVTSAGELLETSQSQVSKTVSEKQILELPGRNSLNGLALLNPGVLPNQNGRPGSGFAVNGNRTRSNNFTIDGANNNDQSLSIPRQNLPPDALQEFQIITNTFAAEFGRNAGSYVNQITKSGTNQFSGSAFWAWDGNKFNALTTNQERTFKANVATLGKDKALRNARSVQIDNIYGGTFGGPIVKNHTFFFTSLDFNPFRTTVSSASRTAISALGRQRLQYAGRTVSSQALNYLLTNFPAANDPTSQGSLTLSGTAALASCPPTDPTSCNVIPFEVYNRGRDAGIPYGTDFKRWLMKINTRLFKSDQLSFRYLVDVSKDPGSPTSIPGQEVGQNLRNDSFTINDSMLLSARWLNEARFTYSRRDITFPENLGIAFSVAGTGGALNLGNANFPQFRTDNVYEITDNVSFTPSNHAFKFGYNLLIYKLASFFAPNFRGSVSYPSLTNFLQDTAASYQQYAGDGLTDATTFENSFFAQDDWRVTPDLTLNLGLRYEYVTTPFGFFSNAKPDINNFGPRLGFAWNPKNILGGHAVVRGGFAIAYDQVFQNVLLNNSRNYPRGVNLSFTNVNGALPFINLPAPPPPSSFTGNPLLLPIRLFSPNERVKQPQSMQWTLGVQYELPAGWIFKADYIGTKGSNLIREVETNYGFCGAVNPLSKFGTSCSASAAVLAQERIDPTRASVLVGQGIASSIYHAGQFTIERRFSGMSLFGSNFGNVIMNANYTYSSYISEADDVLGGQTNRTLPADPRNPKLDRARSGFDQPHRFVMNIVWESPRVLSGANGFFAKQIASRLLNGWLWSAVATYASGTPFSVLSANNALGITPGQVSTVEGSQRVSVNPSGQYPLVSTPTAPNPNAYFIVNPVSSGILGNLGANTERTGSTYNWNMALAKSFKTFGERQMLQLRVEAYNVFNHRNFTVIPANTIGNNVNTTTFLNLGFTNVGGRSFLFGAAYRF